MFLLAALSGTIVLTMATSNAGRYTHSKEEQQAYLAVASAAKFVKDELNGFSVTISFELDSKNKKLTHQDNKAEGSQFLQDIAAISKGCEYHSANSEIPNPTVWLGDGYSGYEPLEKSTQTSTVVLQLDKERYPSMGDVEIKVSADNVAWLTFEFIYKGNSTISYACKMTFGPPHIKKTDVNGSSGISTVTCVYTWDTENVPVEAV